ncbi:hypothetical protein [Ruegeria atlantica]|uniref:hypothetical protein n=1 Tax=Ruegeria atlantica TaxID=81569 RepID=UPI0024957E90|nr:hypothetical protein [Ruegeria atlantica]
MKWKKLGHVFGPDGAFAWSRHSALQPTPYVMNDRIRVFCGFRDDDGQSRVGFVDVSLDDPCVVLRVSEKPVIDLGEIGHFDQNGVVPCAILQAEQGIFLYYAGYQRGQDVRFTVFGGLAISTNGGETFERYSTEPVFGATKDEPLFRVIHSILRENSTFRAWYGGGNVFTQGKKKTLPVYNIRYLESESAITFPSRGSVAVENSPGEHRVGRPYVIRRGKEYIMFFGKGTEEVPYKLTYATSKDGIEWERHGSISGLELSKKGWDSQMMAYPAIVEVQSGTYMFYNGNDYGREGFGCAKLVSW